MTLFYFLSLEGTEFYKITEYRGKWDIHSFMSFWDPPMKMMTNIIRANQESGLIDKMIDIRP